MCLNSRRELRPFEKGELNVLQSTAADGHAYLRRPEGQNDSTGRLLQVVARLTLFQIPYALLERPEPTKEVGTDRSLGEAQVRGDLFGAQPLLEAERDRRPVLVW